MVNIIHQNPDIIDKVWKIIKKIRKNLLAGNTKCNSKIFNKILEKDIKTNINNVEKNLKIKPTNNINYENMTKDILQTGAEMFTYLNFCPPRKILNFYKELLFKGTNKDIILAVTNMMKTRRNAEKSASIRIWNQIDKELKHLSYKKIESVAMRKMNKSEFENCTKQSSEDFKYLG